MNMACVNNKAGCLLSCQIFFKINLDISYPGAAFHTQPGPKMSSAGWGSSAHGGETFVGSPLEPPALELKRTRDDPRWNLVQVRQNFVRPDKCTISLHYSRSFTKYWCYLDTEEKKDIWNSIKAKFSHNKWQRTDWLSFQEVNVVKHLPLFGSQIVQPILYNALTLLKTITVMEREKKEKTYNNWSHVFLIPKI